MLQAAATYLAINLLYVFCDDDDDVLVAFEDGSADEFVVVDDVDSR